MVSKGYEGIKSGQPWSRAVKMWSAHGQKRGRLELKCLNLDKPDLACLMRKIQKNRQTLRTKKMILVMTKEED